VARQRGVGQLTADGERWLRAVAALGAGEDQWDRPWLQGLIVGISFMLGALVPTLPFLTPLPRPRWWAFGLTALMAVLLGAMKARFTLKEPLRNGIERLLIVGVGTLAGVGIGILLHAIRGKRSDRGHLTKRPTSSAKATTQRNAMDGAWKCQAGVYPSLMSGYPSFHVNLKSGS